MMRKTPNEIEVKKAFKRRILFDVLWEVKV
jgi:hypothetical protein